MMPISVGQVFFERDQINEHGTGQAWEVWEIVGDFVHLALRMDVSRRVMVPLTLFPVFWVPAALAVRQHLELLLK